MSMRPHWCGELRVTDVGATVPVCGWVDARREHGEHLAFVDVRDRTGIVQCVVDGAHERRSEYVVRITGTDNREITADELFGVEGVVTVGALNNFDEAAQFSNYGDPVSLTAPSVR